MKLLIGVLLGSIATRIILNRETRRTPSGVFINPSPKYKKPPHPATTCKFKKNSRSLPPGTKEDNNERI